MAQNSKIEWTDKTWNPVTGCTKVSQGCKHCYAERIYERFNGKGSFKNVICHEDRLSQPLKWRKPAMVFVNSMSDLFHEDVPFEFIIEIFAIMWIAKDHTFQILTKRAERMYEVLNSEQFQNEIGGAVNRMFDKYIRKLEQPLYFDNEVLNEFPLKNVWLGVSVEDQKAAEERIPFLLRVPATTKFLSCEPLLGPVDLTDVGVDGCMCNVLSGVCDPVPVLSEGESINWVIAGGESGIGARPMHPDWVRSLRDQCKSADVPFFFKQWGEYWPGEKGRLYRNKTLDYTDGQQMVKVGKKNAGRLLDGVLYNEFPKQTTYASTNDR